MGIFMLTEQKREGSFRVPDWFVETTMKELNDGELRALLFLMRHANKNGLSYYKIKNIAKESGMGVRKTRESLHSLKDSGYITVDPRNGTSSNYYLHERFVETCTNSTATRSGYGGTTQDGEGVLPKTGRGPLTPAGTLRKTQEGRQTKGNEFGFIQFIS